MFPVTTAPSEPMPAPARSTTLSATVNGRRNPLLSPTASMTPCPYRGCRKFFNRNSQAYKDHLFLHLLKRPWVCGFESCGKRFESQGNLQRHITAHKRSEAFFCSIGECRQRFRWAAELSAHCRKVHATEKAFSCTVESCPVRFARRATARHHVFSHHTATRTFFCPIQDCVKRFKDKKNLDQHLLGHSGEKPFPCPVEGCEKRFTRQTYIRTHLLIHSGDKPFSCSQEDCIRTFLTKQNLRNHLRSHHARQSPLAGPVEGSRRQFRTPTAGSIQMFPPLFPGRHCPRFKPHPCPASASGREQHLSRPASLQVHYQRHNRQGVPSSPVGTCPPIDFRQENPLNPHLNFFPGQPRALSFPPRATRLSPSKEQRHNRPDRAYDSIVTWVTAPPAAPLAMTTPTPEVQMIRHWQWMQSTMEPVAPVHQTPPPPNREGALPPEFLPLQFVADSEPVQTANQPDAPLRDPVQDQDQADALADPTDMYTFHLSEDRRDAARSRPH